MATATVTYDSTTAALLCTCGNEPDYDGFFSAESDGTILDPDSDAQFELLWDGETMVCAQCLAVFKWNSEEAFKIESGGDASAVQPVVITANQIK